MKQIDTRDWFYITHHPNSLNGINCMGAISFVGRGVVDLVFDICFPEHPFYHQLSNIMLHETD